MRICGTSYPSFSTSCERHCCTHRAIEDKSNARNLFLHYTCMNCYLHRKDCILFHVLAFSSDSTIIFDLMLYASIKQVRILIYLKTTKRCAGITQTCHRRTRVRAGNARNMLQHQRERRNKLRGRRTVFSRCFQVHVCS